MGQNLERVLCSSVQEGIDSPQESDIKIGYTKHGAWSYIETDGHILRQIALVFLGESLP